MCNSREPIFLWYPKSVLLETTPKFQSIFNVYLSSKHDLSSPSLHAMDAVMNLQQHISTHYTMTAVYKFFLARNIVLNIDRFY